MASSLLSYFLVSFTLFHCSSHCRNFEGSKTIECAIDSYQSLSDVAVAAAAGCGWVFRMPARIESDRISGEPVKACGHQSVFAVHARCR